MMPILDLIFQVHEHIFLSISTVQKKIYDIKEITLMPFLAQIIKMHNVSLRATARSNEETKEPCKPKVVTALPNANLQKNVHPGLGWIQTNPQQP